MSATNANSESFLSQPELTIWVSRHRTFRTQYLHLGVFLWKQYIIRASYKGFCKLQSFCLCTLLLTLIRFTLDKSIIVWKIVWRYSGILGFWDFWDFCDFRDFWIMNLTRLHRCVYKILRLTNVILHLSVVVVSAHYHSWITQFVYHGCPLFDSHFTKFVMLFQDSNAGGSSSITTRIEYIFALQF